MTKNMSGGYGGLENKSFVMRSNLSFSALFIFLVLKKFSCVSAWDVSFVFPQEKLLQTQNRNDESSPNGPPWSPMTEVPRGSAAAAEKYCSIKLNNENTKYYGGLMKKLRLGTLILLAAAILLLMHTPGVSGKPVPEPTINGIHATHRAHQRYGHPGHSTYGHFSGMIGRLLGTGYHTFGQKKKRVQGYFG
ncbi:unnamed protein product [Notodromas monacha]|uniref:Uncharacterized protein n=1 Tax=Notodromas monacha TaxID=399045 RepID=A0A7R9GCK8_9CRUS|nr:unnamed protein product [Notodromas monacha]CAG0916214.1 unnamed protein product [Notodromas monacha]